jgi:hypothetical protein
MLISEVRERFTFLEASLCQAIAIAMTWRLLAGFESFAEKYCKLEDLNILKKSLFMAESWIGEAALDQQTVLQIMRSIEPLLPDTVEYEDESASFGLDFASAVHLSLEAHVSNPAKCLLDVSVLSVDSADRAAQRVLMINVFDPAAEESILSHPIMRAEILAQSTLVDIVCSATSVTEAIAKGKIFAVDNMGSTALMALK